MKRRKKFFENRTTRITMLFLLMIFIWVVLYVFSSKFFDEVGKGEQLVIVGIIFMFVFLFFSLFFYFLLRR